MFVYHTTKATVETSAAVGFTTNGVANTLSTHMRYATVSPRPCNIQALYIIGRGAGLTAISGIAIKVVRAGTIGSGGTAAVPRPRDAGQQAAVTTPFSDTTAITAGVTPTLSLVIGCGAAGPGGWVAPNPDSVISLATAGAANGNAEIGSTSGTISLGFELGVEHWE